MTCLPIGTHALWNRTTKRRTLLLLLLLLLEMMSERVKWQQNERESNAHLHITKHVRTMNSRPPRTLRRVLLAVVVRFVLKRFVCTRCFEIAVVC